MKAQNNHDSKVAFRIATEKDIEDIYKIERQAFTVPWPKDAFYQDILMNRFAVYVLLEYGGKVVGYCGVWIVIDEAHITNIALLPDYRGKKLGQRLLQYVMELAREAGAKTMTLEVRVSNIPARNLYKKLGFKEGGIRKNYYTDNQEDAQIMWVNL